MEKFATIKEALKYALETCGANATADDVARAMVSEELASFDGEGITILYNEYLSENYPDDMYYSFDEDTFNELFSNPFEAMRMGYFGKIQSFSDEYFKLNGYGNIETADAWDIASEAKDDMEFINDIADDWDKAERLSDNLGDNIDFVRDNWEEIAKQLEKLA